MRPARHLTFVLVAVLACLVLSAAVVSTWVSTVVTDSDAYVDTVGPLADDSVVQDFVEESLVAATLERLPQAPPAAVRRAAARVVQGPEFRPAWDEANRSAHEQLVAALEADSDSPVADDGRVTIQVGTLVIAVLDIVDTRGRIDTSTVPDVQTSFQLMDGAELDQARDYYRLVDAAGLWVPVLWAALFVVALLVAVRRRRALAWLAAGSVLALGALLVVLAAARAYVVDRAPTSESDVIGAMWDVVVAGLRNGTWLAIGVALATLVVSLLLGLLLGRPRVDRPDPA